MVHECKSLSEQFSASDSWRASQPTHRHSGGLKHSPGLRLSSIGCFGHTNKSLLLCGKFNGLWQAAKHGPDHRYGGGEEKSAISTFSNDDSKWRHGLLGGAEWYYLFGLQWKGQQHMNHGVKDNGIISLSMWSWKLIIATEEGQFFWMLLSKVHQRSQRNYPPSVTYQMGYIWNWRVVLSAFVLIMLPELVIITVSMKFRCYTPAVSPSLPHVPFAHSFPEYAFPDISVG